MFKRVADAVLLAAAFSAAAAVAAFHSDERSDLPAAMDALDIIGGAVELERVCTSGDWRLRTLGCDVCFCHPMQLSFVTRLGPYDIVAAIGACGEVYRATARGCLSRTSAARTASAPAVTATQKPFAEL